MIFTSYQDFNADPDTETVSRILNPDTIPGSRYNFWIRIQFLDPDTVSGSRYNFWIGIHFLDLDTIPRSGYNSWTWR